MKTAEEIEQLAELHADEYYDRLEEKETSIAESILWQNRKFTK